MVCEYSCQANNMLRFCIEYSLAPGYELQYELKSFGTYVQPWKTPYYPTRQDIHGRCADALLLGAYERFPDVLIRRGSRKLIAPTSRQSQM